MATVYLAVNERVDREVAIKFLRPEVGRDPEAVARFRSEARAAGRIGSKHICEILDLGESPIGPYIVMERLRGIDLAALIRRQTRLNPGYAVRVVRHALEGLAAAHEAGIVHRDLKPANIFLHRTDAGDTVVKLMDFGVSKFLDGTGDAQTASGILLGTPEYMAPEQLEGAHKIGKAADIWAMGAILYRAITGHQVFSGPTLAAVIKSMALDEVTPVSQLVEGVPPELEAVIHRCLQRDIEARFPTTEELSEALEPFEELEIQVVPLAEPVKTLAVSLDEMSELSPEDGGADAPKTQILAEDGSESARPSVPAFEQVDAKRGGGGRATRRGLWVGLVLIVGAALGFAATQLLGEGGADESGTSADPVAATPGTGTGTGTDESGTAGEAGVEATGETGLGAVGETGELVLEERETGETGLAADEDAGETRDSGGSAWVAATDRPPPPGTFRSEAYIAPKNPSSMTDLAGAKDYCKQLAAENFAGVGRWSLPNPAQLRTFIGSEVKRGRYWTTALHKGRAWSYHLPGGKKNSEKASRRAARALCVAKY